LDLFTFYTPATSFTLPKMSAKDMERFPLTGINVLIVGGGLGGMSAAIESYRKGHNVLVLEKRKDFDTFGTP
jgi:NADPH-dependent 2,4-dienoyl-CoA reductase/sulfur reductase-like enzyme